jgi:hypothetical protein
VRRLRLDSRVTLLDALHATSAAGSGDVALDV